MNNLLYREISIEEKIMNKKLLDWSGECVWCVGASSGIGQSLVNELLKKGATVIASSRSISKEEFLKSLDPDTPTQQLHIAPLDVTRETELEQLVKNFPQMTRAFFVAADYYPQTAQTFDLKLSKKMVDININGTLNFLNAVLPFFLKKGVGHIVLVSSIASLIGLPSSSVYGATKAFMLNLSESLFYDLEKSPVGLSIVLPGFVETKLTAKNEFPMPFIMKPKDAALEIMKGVEKGEYFIIFPKLFSYFFRFTRIMPYKIHFWMMRNFVKTS